MKMIRLLVTLIALLAPGTTFASASEVSSDYPKSLYIVGIGEVQSSGDELKDRRRAEILARLEIAKQLRVRVKEESMDIMCEGKTSGLFKAASECRSSVSSLIEVTVDEVLVGSRIADTKKDEAKGAYYAVAILPRKEAAAKIENDLKLAIERAKDSLNEARAISDPETKKALIEKAKEELIKGIVYESERSALVETKARAKEIFERLAEEIRKAQ